METYVGGNFIFIWKCDKHINERWDFFNPEDPVCIPCELLKSRAEVERLTVELQLEKCNAKVVMPEMMKKINDLSEKVERLSKVAEAAKTVMSTTRVKTWKDIWGNVHLNEPLEERKAWMELHDAIQKWEGK